VGRSGISGEYFYKKFYSIRLMAAKSLPRITVAVLATMTGLYPAFYYIVQSANPGVLARKPAELLASYFYRGSFYAHITFGGIALLIGWLQFSKKIRSRHIDLHRGIGKAYMVAVALSGISGLTIAMSATGGAVCMAGFGLLAIGWLYTDFQGYRAIRRLDIGRHRAWMLRNYSLTFAAVTLRIYLPLATAVMHLDFISSYRVISWLCWVPNLVVAEMLIRRAQKTPEGASTGVPTPFQGRYKAS
jgi:uncharacterized membrane protein